MCDARAAINREVRAGRSARALPVESKRSPHHFAHTLKIIAVDTSTEYCSAALLCDGEITARETHAGQSHSQLLLGMVDELLRARSLRIGELDAIAYGEGPGSFTGLRIACGVVQGLAFGADLPVVGIGSLLAMAAGTTAPRVVCCVDARMGEVYHAAYENDGTTWRERCAPSVCPPDSVPALRGGGWLGCGSGFSVYHDVLCTRYRGALAQLEPDRYPNAREIAALAAPRFAANDTAQAELASPVYVRDKVALRTDERAPR
jgi:tRNA threonylcarbamoyladenosine biosynthesis protein TsaB